MPIRFVLIITALLALVPPGASAGVSLRYSGILRQSQPPGSEPLTSAAMRGAVIDQAGHLWTFADGKQLRRFVRQPNGGWVLKESFKGPTGLAYDSPIQLLGNHLVYRGGYNLMFAFDLTTKTFQKLVKLPENCSSAQAFMGEDGLSYVALAENSVHLFSPTSKEWRKLFDVSPPKEGKLYSIGILPQNGHILVGSSYPDLQVRCFAPDGKEQTNSFFPRNKIHSRVMVNAAGQPWALGNTAVSLLTRQPSLGSETPLSDCSGLARANDGSLWLAANEGLVGFNANREPLNIRVGGLGNHLLMALAPDGTLAVYEGIMRLLMIDDLPSTPLGSRASPKYLVGQRYDTRATALCYDYADARFLVLDDKQNRLWSFKPGGPWYRNFWKPLSAENAFKRPTGLAQGGDRVFVVDSGQVLVRHRSVGEAREDAFIDVGVAVDGPIAANRNGVLFAVRSKKICSYYFDARGEPVLRWTSSADFGEINGIAAGERYIAVAEKKKITILSVVDGAVECQLGDDAIKEGFSASSITITEPWVLFGDLKGRRIARLRILKKN